LLSIEKKEKTSREGRGGSKSRGLRARGQFFTPNVHDWTPKAYIEKIVPAMGIGGKKLEKKQLFIMPPCRGHTAMTMGSLSMKCPRTYWV
jgi:hypothetical protein